MTEPQLQLVRDAVEVYKQIRADLPGALPFWPLGLPRWTDSWLALGMRAPGSAYVLAWRRGPGFTNGSDQAAEDPAELSLPIGQLRGHPLRPEVLYPRADRPTVSWDRHRGELAVALPEPPAACLVRLA
jgi:alpha-galactosidase